MPLNTIDLIPDVSFVASIIFFFFSVVQLSNKKKPLSNYFLSVIYFSIGIQALSFWFYCRNSSIFERYFYYSDTAFIFLIGAFLYLFFVHITSEVEITLKMILLHASPFFVSLIFIEAINLSQPLWYENEWIPVFDYIFSVSYLSLFIYLILILRILLPFYRKKSAPEIKILIFIIVCSIVFSLMLLLSTVVLPELLPISQTAFSLIAVFSIFFLVRYPGFFRKVQEESQEKRYRNSHLEGIDKQKVIEKLNALIEHEKIYINRTLTLKALSDKLNLTQAQLSELLNSQFEANYNNFINSHRVEEARRILNEKPDMNMLKIAFECGFNSKTTFNTAFKKFTGLTPTEYKKQLDS